ncbi:MAG: 2-oxoacid:acceptor oxidoreductase family protein [Pseudomonadota bacterium]
MAHPPYFPLVTVNSTKTWNELGITDQVSHLPDGHVVGINASALAKEHVGRPVPNAALLGGFAAVGGVIELEAVQKAISTKFGGAVIQAAE